MTESDWTGVILAGGLGSRLMPLTRYICKPAVSVTNQPMIDYAIDSLRYAGVKKIIICVKKFGELLKKQVERNWNSEVCKKYGLEIIIPNNDSKGTADAVRKVAQYIDTPNFVVSMADIVTNLPMKKFMDFHEEKKGFSTISMKRIDQMATKYGNTLLNNDSRILRFLEKPSSEEIYYSAITGGKGDSLPIINTGIYCFKHELIDILKSTTFMDFGHEVFPFLLENSYDLFGFVDDYYWLDIGNPLTYLWSNWDMLRLYGWPNTPMGERNGDEHQWAINNEFPSLESNVELGDKICLGKNNQYGNNIKIKSLSSIGSNCIIGDNVTIERSVIWDNVVIGSGSEITESVIANDCVIGNDCKILNESILGPKTIVSDNSSLHSEKRNGE